MNGIFVGIRPNVGVCGVPAWNDAVGEFSSASGPWGVLSSIRRNVQKKINRK